MSSPTGDAAQLGGIMNAGLPASHRNEPPWEPDSTGQGLRDLAKGEGPELGKLINPYTPGLRALMSLTTPLEKAGITAEGRARAIRQYIWELIAGFSDEEHPKCKAALQAAFCLGPGVDNGREHPSITERLKIVTRMGAFGDGADPEEGEESWQLGVRRLAELVETNIDGLRLPAGWASKGSPSGYQPVRVRDLTVTYFLTGQTVAEVITERRIEAAEDGVDRYIVRDYVQGAPNARIEVSPLLNCKAGAHIPVDLGPGFVAVKADMLLPATYTKGSGCNFATRVKRTGLTDPTTWQEIQVTSHGVDTLTMRVQFDTSVPLPTRCWHFAAVPDLGRLDPPDPAEQRDLDISSLGYVEKYFGNGQAAAKYGIVWRW